MIKYLLYFLVGGGVVTSAALLAELGHPFLGGILMILPNISLTALYFINKVSGASSAVVTIKSSLLGTLLVWPLYMLSLLYLIPKFGVNKSLFFGFIVSLIFALLFVVLAKSTFISSWIHS